MTVSFRKGCRFGRSKSILNVELSENNNCDYRRQKSATHSYCSRTSVLCLVQSDWRMSIMDSSIVLKKSFERWEFTYSSERFGAFL